MKCSVIILAAGGSTRLGEPKQLLIYKGKTLLQHTVDVAIESGVRRVVVVLGANADEAGEVVKSSDVHVIYNKDWQDGMASSIRHGITEIQKIDPSSEVAIVMMCDQPFVSSSVITSLIHTAMSTGKPIVASRYRDAVGPPALFTRRYFDELLALTGDIGARKIITTHADEVATVDFPGGEIDIDSPQDWQQFLSDTRPE